MWRNSNRLLSETVRVGTLVVPGPFEFILHLFLLVHLCVAAWAVLCHTFFWTHPFTTGSNPKYQTIPLYLSYLQNIRKRFISSQFIIFVGSAPYLSCLRRFLLVNNHNQTYLSEIYKLLYISLRLRHGADRQPRRPSCRSAPRRDPSQTGILGLDELSPSTVHPVDGEAAPTAASDREQYESRDVRESVQAHLSEIDIPIVQIDKRDPTGPRHTRCTMISRT